MRSRAAQLACLVLLLTSLSAADGSARAQQFSVGGHYVSILLQQTAAAACAESPLTLLAYHRVDALPVASRMIARSVWSVRPPEAQSAHVQVVTAFRI